MGGREGVFWTGAYCSRIDYPTPQGRQMGIMYIPEVLESAWIHWNLSRIEAPERHTQPMHTKYATNIRHVVDTWIRRGVRLRS